MSVERWTRRPGTDDISTDIRRGIRQSIDERPSCLRRTIFSQSHEVTPRARETGSRPLIDTGTSDYPPPARAREPHSASPHAAARPSFRASPSPRPCRGSGLFSGFVLLILLPSCFLLSPSSFQELERTGTYRPGPRRNHEKFPVTRGISGGSSSGTVKGPRTAGAGVFTAADSRPVGGFSCLIFAPG